MTFVCIFNLGNYTSHNFTFIIHVQVLILRRRKAGFHCSYDWFDKYCGSRDDFNSLLALAVRTSLKTCTTSLPNLKDEFAPVSLYNGGRCYTEW